MSYDEEPQPERSLVLEVHSPFVKVGRGYPYITLSPRTGRGSGAPLDPVFTLFESVCAPLESVRTPLEPNCTPSERVRKPLESVSIGMESPQLGLFFCKYVFFFS